MSKLNPSDWLIWDEIEVLPYNGGTSFHVRTIDDLLITTENEFPVHQGKGEAAIDISGDGALKFFCEGTIWLKPTSRVQERIEQSEAVFTSMDRPAPLSPEMLAISRMMRKNEIERANERAEMERRYASRPTDPEPEREPEEPASEVPAKTKKKVGAEPAGSEERPAKQEKSAPSEDPAPD